MRQTLWKILAIAVSAILAGCVQQAPPAVPSPSAAPSPMISPSPSPSPASLPTPLLAKLDPRVNPAKLEGRLFAKLSKGYDPGAGLEGVVMLSQQNFSAGMIKLRSAGASIKNVYGTVVLVSMPYSALNEVLLMPEVQYVDSAKRE